MKKIILLSLTLLFFSSAFSQSVPEGMKYQAVARDVKGQILANQKIALKISLVNGSGTPTIFYSEVHDITTNELGLFTLVIGQGAVDAGVFKDVPWSTEDIWMQVSIKDKGKGGFSTISNSKLLAVPYAFHAATAAELVGNNKNTASISSAGVPSQVWSLKGNGNSVAGTDNLGTTDLQDLVIITNNIERLRVKANGDVELKNTLQIGNDLNVGGLAALNNATQSTLPTNGALVVAGGAGIGKNLNVGGNANITGTTQLQNTLTVDDAVTLKKTIDITGAATLANTLDVTGKSRFRDSVTFDKSLAITGDVNSSSINISANTSSYLATFQNTNDGEGDGIKISLGRAKSSYTLPAAPTFESSTQFADLLNCDISETQKIVTLANIVKDDAIETGKTMAGIAVSAGNMIINVINDGLQLPLSIPDITVPDIHLSNAIDVSGPINSNLGLPIFLGPYSTPSVVMPAVKLPALSVDVGALGSFDIIGETTLIGSTTLLPATTIIPNTQIVPSLPAFSIPAIDIPKTTLLTGRTVMPKLPKIDLTSIGIPEIDISSLKFWGLDIDICLDEGSSSPLNNSNEFIRFADKNDAQVGSIRGVSVANWSLNYLNPVFFNKLRGAFLSSKADKFHAQYHFKQEITTALASYAKIGVEYSSGNGDYAEWLERSDKMEVVSAGDIVSVKGGKITKDLTNAEQVMVVSHAPIMLGNMPVADKIALGNSIVFIGQAPVKIMGPVTSGDYIVGQINTPGYGIAKHQADMTLEDFKLVVGRSWDTDESKGVKLANTVIGIHNSGFLGLIKDLKEKADHNDARLQAIEAKLNISVPGKSMAAATRKKK